MLRAIAMGLFGTVLVLCANPALASPIGASQESNWLGQFTAGVFDVKITGATGIGDRIDVTYTLPNGTVVTKTDVGVINQSGVAVIRLAVPTGTVMNFHNSTEDKNAPPLTVAGNFTPPGQIVITRPQST